MARGVGRARDRRRSATLLRGRRGDRPRSEGLGAALAAGIEVDWRSPNATYAEIVEHLRSAGAVRPDGSPRRVAVQLDGEPRSTFAGTLRTLGYDVVAVPVYTWALPDALAPAERVVTAVAERTIDAVTFTSAHAVSSFAGIAERMGLSDAVGAAFEVGAVLLVCVGGVTAARAKAEGFGRCVVPSKPRLGAMVQAMVVEFSGRAVTLDLGGSRVAVQGRLVSVGGGAPVRLTDREHAVLETLVRRPGAVVSKRELLDRVWSGESDEHVVEVTVGRLRRRLGAAGASIETVVRRGYRLATR
ncbi:MAG: uroporphyrinogen-III synthase [Microthrixaceae bacterium]